MMYIEEDTEILIESTSGRKLLLHTGAVASKSARDTQGIQTMTQRKGHSVSNVTIYKDEMLQNPHRYRARSLPSAGALPSAGEQISILSEDE